MGIPSPPRTSPCSRVGVSASGGLLLVQNPAFVRNSSLCNPRCRRDIDNTANSGFSDDRWLSARIGTGIFTSNRKFLRRQARCSTNVVNVVQDTLHEKTPQHKSANGFAVSPAELKSLLSSGHVFSSGTVASADQLAAELGSSLQVGLSTSEEDFEARKRYYGENRLPDKQETAFWEFLKEALDDYTVGVLIVAGITSIGLDFFVEGDTDNGWIEGAAILMAVVVVVMVTAVNNYQKEKQFMELNALQKAVMVRVVRDGQEKEIASDDLLVGDVLVIETGDIVPADGLMFTGHNVRVDESNLTGESDDVEKDPLHHPVMFSGSKVLEGVGKMLLTAVGVNSQQGQIMSLATGGGSDEDSAALREETLLQTKLSVLANQIGQFGLAAGLLATLAMSVEFSYDTFWVQHNVWNLAYLNSYLHFFILGITILVVAIPEGLPLATTIGLAYSVKRMLADNNLVRHLAAAETMGCATTICCDKTGTLTQNDMAVVRCNVAGSEISNVRSLRQQLKDRLMGKSNGTSSAAADGTMSDNTRQLLGAALAVNSTAHIQLDTATGDWVKRGNRTECALLELACALGADVTKLRQENNVLQQFPFSSERKRMSTLAYRADHTIDGMVCGKLFTKGAAEVVLSMCDNQLRPDGTVAPMTDEDKARLLASFGKDGRRMLCVAYRDMFLPTSSTMGDAGSGDLDMPASSAEAHLTYLAMMGLEDPLRPQVAGAITQLQRAGITVRMLTGDNALTAFSIARQCGIVPKDAPLPKHIEVGSQGLKAWRKQVLDWLAMETQTSIDSMDGKAGMKDGEFLVMESNSFRKFVLNSDGTINQEAFNKVWPKLRVLARCTPLDKYTIVKACKNRPSEIVAMTGDGTNDAPALRLANVGFAMASGTSIAKDASDILLLDDNLDSIVQAVKWGRNVYAGATKFLQFQLTINIGAVITATLGAFVLRDSPLAAIQMLWVNLIMDSLASLSLATEAPGDDTLDRPPYSTEGSLVTPTVLKNVIGQSVFQLSVMYWLVFQSPAVFGYTNGALLPQEPSVHYTMVFNTFVFMQLFNQINARKLRDDQSVFDGITTDRIFILVLALEAAIQVLLVQFGGKWFQTTPLGLDLWAVCVGFGATGLIVREGLKYWTVSDDPKLQRSDTTPSNS